MIKRNFGRTAVRPYKPQSKSSGVLKRSLKPTALSWPASSQPRCVGAIHFGGQDEITFAEAVDFVGPDLDLDLAPGQIKVRVMSLLFGDFPLPD